MLHKNISWLLAIGLTTMIHWSPFPPAVFGETGRQMSPNELVQRGKELRNEIDSVYQTLKAEKKLSGRGTDISEQVRKLFRPDVLLTTQKKSCDPRVLPFIRGR